MNKLQWNFNRNYNIFIQENAFESVVCERAAILSRPQCVKTRVTVRKRQILLKICNSFVTCDLENWWMTLKNNRAPLLCDLQIWQMTLKNNRAPHLTYFKLCASFLSHRSIQTWVTVWKRQIWVKIVFHVTLKFNGWPLKTIGHLSYATSSFVHHFISICEFKLSSYSPEMAKLGFDLCDFDLWPLTLTFLHGHHFCQW